jgi:hypothetical protein
MNVQQEKEQCELGFETYFFGLELLGFSKLGGGSTAQTSLSTTGVIGFLLIG